METLWPLIVNPDDDSTGITYFVKGHERVWGGRCNSLDSWGRIVRNMAHCRNTLYVNINPSSHAGTKGKTEDVTHWRHILIDIDPVTKDAMPGGAFELLEPLLPAGCCSVINSGRGIQVWVSLTPTPLSSSSQRRRIEEATAWYLRKFTIPKEYGCVVDTSCSDLARIARPPGSYNSKTGRVARLLLTATRCFDPRSILDAAPPYVEPVVPQRLTESSNLVRVLPHLTEKATTFLLEGYREPGRHQAAYATAANLAELGVEQSQAATWMARARLLCSPPLADTDLTRAINSAYKRHYGKTTEATE